MYISTDMICYYICLWPFDGNLSELLAMGGMTIAKIYPAECYRYLNIRIGPGMARSKTNRQQHSQVCPRIYKAAADMLFNFTDAASSWIDAGFDNEDQYDALVGLISMLKVVPDQIPRGAPDTPAVRLTKGWILGQLEINFVYVLLHKLTYFPLRSQ